MNISSVGVDTTGVPFLTDTGIGGTADKVFKFDPSTGSRVEVGALNEATGLPSDTSNRVYYGNVLVNAASSGRIERTTADLDQELFRNCGNAGGGDPCHVWGIGLDPDLTDFGPQGRVDVADGASNKVRVVPDGGMVTDFATGFNFGNSPRGVVVDRNSGSSFYHDVFIADATAVRRYDSSMVPGTLQKTYDASNSPIISPRQMAITPLPRERLLIADDGRDGLIMINPDTDASKLLNIPFSNPRGIALDEDAGGVTFAYVAEQTRVLKVPIHETLVVSIWVANGALIDDRLVRDLVERVGIGLEPCGIEVQIRDDAINDFDPGVLLDLETTDWSIESCADPLLERTAEEAALLDAPSRRSSVAEDLNIYFVKSFETAGVAEAVTEDCFSDVSDDTGSGIIISVEKLAEFGIDAVPTLAHEVGHALIDRTAWSNSTGNVHFDLADTEYTPPNIMSTAKTIGTGRDRRTLDDSDQCLNINTNAIIFRGDP